MNKGAIGYPNPAPAVVDWPPALMGVGVIGSWYAASGLPAAGFNNQSLSAGTLVLGTPMVAPEDMTIDSVGCYVQSAGTTGAVVRIGVYQPLASNPYRLALNSPYATLLADGGTIPATTSATRATAALGTPLLVTKGTAFCVGVAVQVAAVGVYCEAISNLWHGPWGSVSDSILNGPRIGVSASGVTGALPPTFIPTAFLSAGVGGAGFFRRSA